MSDGRRERKKQATRSGLALAALELSLEHGPDEVTIEQIAVRADVTPRTFFNHFPSKEDAILYAVDNELHIAEERRNPGRWLDVLRPAERRADHPVNAHHDPDECRGDVPRLPDDDKRVEDVLRFARLACEADDGLG